MGNQRSEIQHSYITQKMASSNKDLSDCMNEFTLDVYKHLTAEQASDNLFMSPSSMMVVMAMLHVGARNKTQEQMSKVLKFEKLDKNTVLKHMETFVRTLKKGSNSVTLSMANRLYPRTDKTILQDYITLVSKHFMADVKSMDYTTQAEKARGEINQWVEKETNNKIVDLLPAGSLNALTAMVVVNAIYFKGNWASQFQPRKTRKSNFTKLTSDKVELRMMHKCMKFVKYAENKSLACKVLELPYEGEEMAMVIILPHTNDGLPEVEKQLTRDVMLNLVSAGHSATVNVSLPKFKLKTSLELKTVFSALGMPDLFNDDSADLTGMGKYLYVTQMYHKAFVDVNEEGTEAAAATAADDLMIYSLEPTLDFNADHPFLFMIWDHRLKVPLFIGRFVNPPNTSRQTIQQTRCEV